MRAWVNLNLRGRLLLVCSIINIWISIVLALDSNSYWIFSIFMAMFCGLATYDPRCSLK